MNPFAPISYDLSAYFAGLRYHLTSVQGHRQLQSGVPDNIDATFDVYNPGLLKSSDNQAFTLELVGGRGAGYDIPGGTVGATDVPPGPTSSLILSTGAEVRGGQPLHVTFPVPLDEVDLAVAWIIIGEPRSAVAVLPLAPGSAHPGLVANVPTWQHLSGSLTAGPDTLTLDSAVIGASNSDLYHEAGAGWVVVEIAVVGKQSNELGANSILATLEAPGVGHAYQMSVAGSAQSRGCCFNGFPHDGTLSAAYFFFEVMSKDLTSLVQLVYARDGGQGSVDITLAGG